MNELKASPKGRISLFGRRRSAGSASQSEAMTIAVGFVSVYRGGSARASRAVFGALAEHAFRSARAPTGAAEAAALPDAKHIRMGEGESSSAGRPFQTLWELRATGLGVPSPVGRERVRVRVVLFEIRFLSG